MVSVKVLVVAVLLLWYGAILLALAFLIRDNRWKFTLRALFLVTTVVAIMLGIAAALTKR